MTIVSWSYPHTETDKFIDRIHSFIYPFVSALIIHAVSQPVLRIIHLATRSLTH